MQNFNASKEYKEIVAYVEHNKKRLSTKLSMCSANSHQFAEVEEELNKFNETSEQLLKHFERKMAA